MRRILDQLDLGVSRFWIPDFGLAELESQIGTSLGIRKFDIRFHARAIQNLKSKIQIEILQNSLSTS